jgi:hypothetical protein
MRGGFAEGTSTGVNDVEAETTEEKPRRGQGQERIGRQVPGNTGLPRTDPTDAKTLEVERSSRDGYAAANGRNDKEGTNIVRCFGLPPGENL